MSINSTEAQASRESKILRSPPHNADLSTHESGLSKLLFGSMSEQNPSIPEGRAKLLRLTFQLSDQDFPTRDKLVEYAGQVDAFRVAMCYMLTYLQVDKTTWPPAPDTTIPETLMQDAAIWCRASEIGEAIAHIKSFLKDTQMNITQQEKEQLH